MNRLEARILAMLAQRDMTIRDIYITLLQWKDSTNYSYIAGIVRKLYRMGYVAPFKNDYKIRGKIVGITLEGMEVLRNYLKNNNNNIQLLEVRDVKR